MKKNPLVTVVTITYDLIKNGRKEYIKQCIESVHNQTYKNIEHIIIDGASSDGTLELLEGYEKKGWLKVYSEPDEGIYYAMNKGIQKATGKYINFLNSDDFFHGKRGVQISVRALEKNNADFSCAPVNFLNENDVRTGILNIFLNSFFLEIPFCHQSMFAKTSVLRKENGFNISYKYAADYDFILRLCLKKTSFVKIDRNFISFRCIGFTSQDNNLVNKKERIKILHAQLSKIEKMTLEEAEKIFTTHTFSKSLYSKIQKNISAELNKELKKNILVSVDNNFFTCINTQKILGIRKVLGIIKIEVRETDREKKWSTCGILLARKKTNNAAAKVFYLFGFLPLTMRETINNIIRKRYYCIFGFIPLIKITQIQEMKKYYLFGLINVGKNK